MRMKFLTACAAALACSSAHAQLRTPPDRTGLYLVGTIGVSQGNDESASFARAESVVGPLTSGTVDARRNNGGIAAGYRFNEFFAIEGGYADLGRMSLQASGTGTFTSTAKIRGGHLELVGLLPVGEDAAVYGKIGGVWARTKYESSDGFSNSTSSVRSFWGLGFQLHFNPNLFGRLEYLRYNNLGSTFSGQTAVNQYSMGVGYLFK